MALKHQSFKLREQIPTGRIGAMGLFALVLLGSQSVLRANDELPDVITVATWNLEWFYDDFQADNRTDLAKKHSAPSRADWDWKLSAVAGVIAKLRPTILCLQEVENRDVVYRLTQELKKKHRLNYRYAFIDGYDFGTEQDVATIYLDGLVEFSRREQTKKMFDSREYYNLNKHLFTRFQWGAGDQKLSLTVANVHLRAQPEKADLRQRQSRLIRYWVDELVERGENVIVTGDLNTEVDFGLEKPGDETSIICGWNSHREAGQLRDAHQDLRQDLRMTHISGRQYDRLLYSESMRHDVPNRQNLVFSRVVVRRDLVVQGAVDPSHWENYYEIPQDERDISDHYPLMAEFVIK